MQTEPDPSPPSTAEAESAVGLTFVAIVLVSLFVAGSLGVVATRERAGAPTRPGAGRRTAAVTATPAALVRDRIVTGSGS
jgi:hypothetical protein